MQHIKIEHLTVSYPVGRNIKSVTEVIKEFIFGFEQLNLPKNTKLNLWCRGSSGAILATAFALTSDYPCFICHVKKPGEDSHSSPIEAYETDGFNVVIDDFVSSGDTIHAILEVMSSFRVKPMIKAHALIVAYGALYEGKGLYDKFETIISNG